MGEERGGEDVRGGEVLVVYLVVAVGLWGDVVGGGLAVGKGPGGAVPALGLVVGVGGEGARVGRELDGLVEAVEFGLVVEEVERRGG